MLKPLLREAPAVLKRYLIANWDEIKRDTEHNEGLGDNDPCNQLPTWKELIHDIVNHACEMDDQLAERSDPRPRGDHQVRPVKQTPPQGTGNRPRENTPKDPWAESREWRNELWRKALALGIPRAVIQGHPTDIILSLIQAFQKRNDGERREHTPNIQCHHQL